MRFYSQTINCPAGEHVFATLPDGSLVKMNANSNIKYYPLWWTFSRTVNFNGEALFKVKKGEKFEVISKNAKTIVLGTEFNIFSRNSDYQVSCLSGKVKVIASTTKDKVILVKNQKAELKTNGSIILHKNEKVKENISWVNNKFFFTSTPINKVFNEIERQYGISIKIEKNINFIYTGNFTKKKIS